MMSYLSIVEKFKILFDMILDVKFIFIFLGVLVIATFLYLIKKIDNRKYIMIITLSLLLILGIDIVINYKELAEVFDNFMTIFFSNIYFPSVYVYVGTLLIVAIAFVTSMFNKMLNKIYKIINGITFVMNNILLVIILNIIAKNKIDVFTPNELYTNINLVAVLEISIGLFVLWVLSLIVVYTTSVICDRIGNKRRELVTCDINSDVEGIDITKDTSSYNNVLTPVEAVSEVKEPSIVTYEIESNNVEPEVIEEVSNVDTNVGTDDVKENNMCVRVIGDITPLEEDMKQSIKELEEATKDNTGLHFQVALNYGSRDEMTRAMRTMTADVKDGKVKPEDISEEMFAGYLDTKGLPDPDLLIRTSGEERLSNFMLWQLAYTEFYFTDVLWPDFNKKELQKAIDYYNKRDRRFGGV